MDIRRDFGCWEGSNLGSEGGVSGVYNDSFLMDNMWSGIPCSELLSLADAAVTGKGSRGGSGGGHGGSGGGHGGSGGGGISYSQQFEHKFDEQPDRTKFLFDLNSPPILPEPELITNIPSQLTPVTPKQTKRTGRERMVSDLINSNEDKITDQNATNLEHSRDDFEVDEDFEDESSDDLDLKKTPQPKQRRRKHRPKVVIEGQTKSSKKSTTPNPNIGSSTGKRKYVRKIAIDKSTETCFNGSTRIRQSTRSCRRKITFDEEWDFEGFEDEKEFELMYGNQILNPITPCKFDTKKHTKNTCSRAKRNLSFSKNTQNDDSSNVTRRDDSLEVHLSMITDFPPIYKKKRTEICYNSSTKCASTWSVETSLFGNLERFRKKRSLGMKRVRDLGSFGGMGKRVTCLEELAADLSFDIQRKKRTNRNYVVSSLSYHNHGFLANYIGFHSSLRWKTTYDMNALINQFQNLGINNHVVEKDQKGLVPYLTRYREKNGIVLYRPNRSVVPYEVIESYNPLKTRPKVDIDDETSRVWRLLLEDINSQGIDGTNEDDSKRWEEERNVFSGRAASFIARMHLVQGDRRFSKWKGSVVDSVIGVFLTQNVSDHLSSSAFINLAAKYPLKSNSSNEQLNEEKWSISVNESCELDDDSYEEKEVVKRNKLKNIIYSHECNEGISEEKCASEESRISAGDEIIQNSKIIVTDNNNNNNEYSNCNVQKAVDIEDSSAQVINIVDNSNFKENGIKKGKGKKGKKIKVDWDCLRKNAEMKKKREKTRKSMDSLDYEAVRCADVDEISDTIKDRGMNNMLAERIKEFLNRLVKDHGSIDLEWLRDVPPDKAKEYLLSFRGLGLKSVECVRLLTLHHLAFPVDTNVGRIAVRLGWVPLQPLPESLQLHLLELYPILESIQKYLWPRLCKLDQRTLYELHYQMITFGKVFCTKNKPNCNSCPMRGECRHFASAFASSRLSLPAPEEKSIVTVTENKIHGQTFSLTTQQPPHLTLPPPEFHNHDPFIEEPTTPEPIVEVPATPEAEKIQEFDLEDYGENCEEIPTIRLNMEEFNQNIQTFIEKNMELTEGDMSRALVAVTSEAASIPTPKLKNVSQLRTEHQVYELPDSHPLLQGLEKREPDDPCSYLLAIWTPGETSESIQPPKGHCTSQESGALCHRETCFLCNSTREANSQTVRGTILIPCRTAMRGSFPLNGTYFQVNEVFADHDSSLNPIDVPRSWLWNLPRRTVYFGTSIPTIFRGLTTESIQYCFWRGFVCVRGFDQKTRAPRPLMARLHFPASKLKRSRGNWAADED